MKNIGIMHPTEILPHPDVVYTKVLVAGSSAHAWDWPSGAAYVNFGSNVDFFANLISTHAIVPSSDLTTGSSAGYGYAYGSSVAQELNPTARRVPPGSTGGSLIGMSSGIVTVAIFTV